MKEHIDKDIGKAQEMETGVRASQDRGGVLEMLEMGARARKGDRSGRPVTWGLFGIMML